MLFSGFCELVLCLVVWQSQWFVLSVYEVSFSSSFFFFLPSSTELTCRQRLTQQHAHGTELTRTQQNAYSTELTRHSRMPTALTRHVPVHRGQGYTSQRHTRTLEMKGVRVCHGQQLDMAAMGLRCPSFQMTTRGVEAMAVYCLA